MIKAMTQFVDKTKTVPKVHKKTVFTKYFSDISEPENAKLLPESFDFVEFIGNSTSYGDVFKAWDKDGDFVLYMGVKGTEFDD